MFNLSVVLVRLCTSYLDPNSNILKFPFYLKKISSLDICFATVLLHTSLSVHLPLTLLLSELCTSTSSLSSICTRLGFFSKPSFLFLAASSHWKKKSCRRPVCRSHLPVFFFLQPPLSLPPPTALIFAGHHPYPSTAWRLSIYVRCLLLYSMVYASLIENCWLISPLRSVLRRTFLSPRPWSPPVAMLSSSSVPCSWLRACSPVIPAQPCFSPSLLAARAALWGSPDVASWMGSLHCAQLHRSCC